MKLYYMPRGYGKTLYLEKINKSEEKEILEFIWLNASLINKSYSIPYIKHQIKNIEKLIKKIEKIK